MKLCKNCGQMIKSKTAKFYCSRHCQFTDIEYRTKMSLALRGEKNGMYGRIQSLETRDKIRQKALGRKDSLGTRIKRSLSHINLPYYKSEKFRSAVSKSLKGKAKNYECWRNFGNLGKKPWNYKKGDYMKGEKNPMYGKKAWNRNLTKADHPSLLRISEKLSGKNCWLWKNGKGYFPYSKEFFQIRPLIKKRDNYLCQFCGKIGAEVHHKDEDKNNNREENLVLLCQHCHQKLHARKLSWNQALVILKLA